MCNSFEPTSVYNNKDLHFFYLYLSNSPSIYLLLLFLFPVELVEESTKKKKEKIRKDKRFCCRRCAMHRHQFIAQSLLYHVFILPDLKHQLVGDGILMRFFFSSGGIFIISVHFKCFLFSKKKCWIIILLTCDIVITKIASWMGFKISNE